MSLFSILPTSVADQPVIVNFSAAYEQIQTTFTYVSGSEERGLIYSKKSRVKVEDYRSEMRSQSLKLMCLGSRAATEWSKVTRQISKLKDEGLNPKS